MQKKFIYIYLFLFLFSLCLPAFSYALDTGSMDYWDKGRPSKYIYNTESGLNIDTGTISYWIFGRPAEYIYKIVAALSISVPTSSAFSNFTLGSSPHQSSLSNMGNIDVSGGSGQAWSATGKMSTNFTVESYTMSIANNLNINPGANGVTVVVSGTGDETVTAGASHTFTALDENTTVISGSGTGTYRVQPSLTLTIPENTNAASSYTATMVFTIQ